MQKEFFDFDKLFEDYLKKIVLSSKGITPEQVRANLDQYFLDWAEIELEELGFVSPSKFFAGIDSSDELIDYLIKSTHSNRRPSVFLLERIREVSDCVARLKLLIAENQNATLTQTAIELLQGMGVSQPLEEYVQLLASCEEGDELRESIIEVLSENAQAVKESLFDLLQDSDLSQKTIIAEILINAGLDKRTSALLVELFHESDNLPLICSYIGKYGDESLVPMLYKAIDTSNYLEYMEIKNAIERMGGIVEDDKDFSEDAFYKIIKDIRD